MGFPHRPVRRDVRVQAGVQLQGAAERAVGRLVLPSQVQAHRREEGSGGQAKAAVRAVHSGSHLEAVPSRRGGEARVPPRGQGPSVHGGGAKGGRAGQRHPEQGPQVRAQRHSQGVDSTLSRDSRDGGALPSEPRSVCSASGVPAHAPADAEGGARAGRRDRARGVAPSCRLVQQRGGQPHCRVREQDARRASLRRARAAGCECH
mmetsp:Transcript_19101/g.47644  ORF Transcript_19101/g.47644 Transcript_19101/m.47644 type:complete len:205 (+) Transcript_19101:140-754(+)